MNNHNLDERKMANAVELLLRGLVLHKGSHPFYISAYEIRNVHYPYPGEMHEQPDVISIYSGEATFTTEILHD